MPKELRQPLTHRRVQWGLHLPPECCGDAGLIEQAAFQQARQAKDGLRGFYMDAIVGECIDQLPVTEQAVTPGGTQSQGSAIT